MTWSFFGNRAQRTKKKPRRNEHSQRKLVPGRRRPRFETLEDRSLLAVLTVNSLLDNSPAGDGLVTLREAVNAANNNTATDLGAVGSGIDTIQFAPGLTGSINLSSGISIGEGATINGPGAANLTINGGGQTGIFGILISGSFGDVTFKGLTLANGNSGFLGGAISSFSSFGLLTVADCVLTGNTALSGGAIFARGDVLITGSTIGTAAAPNRALGNGTDPELGGGAIRAAGNVTLKNSTFSNNQALNGHGGAIQSARSVTVENSSISANFSQNAGGGIFAGETVNLINSRVSGNTADLGGGGIYAMGSVTVRLSTISGNSGHDKGGGIFSSTNVTLEQSTIGGISPADGNVVFGGGGGIVANRLDAFESTIANNVATNNGDTGALGMGGGVYALTMSLRNCTIAGNKATSQGGGLIGNSVLVAQSTVASNNADSDNDAVGSGGGIVANIFLNLVNSIVIGNTAPTSPDIQADAAALEGVRFSLIGNNTDLPAIPITVVTGPLGPANSFGNLIGQPGGANAISIAQVLDPAGLKNNGGPTTTIALLAGSIAINKGRDGFVVSAATGDQRGLPFVRIAGAAVDMGAFEFQTTPTNRPPVTKPIPNQSAAVGKAFAFSFAANTFTDPDNDPLTFSAMLASGGSLPTWLSFNSTTRTFTGTPQAGDIRTINIRVTASDGKGGFAASDFVLTVKPSPPPLTPAKKLPNQTAQVGNLYAYILPNQLFWGLGIVPLTYSASLANGGALPSWLKFNPATQTFWGIPTAANVGALCIRVTATTCTGASAAADFTLTVKPYLWNWPKTRATPAHRR